MASVVIVGAGSWGTTVAVQLAARGASVRLWARRRDLAEELGRDRCNRSYMPDLRFPPSLVVTSSLELALEGTPEMVIMAVPSHGFRSVLAEAVPSLVGSPVLVSLTKGLERGTLMRMTQVMAEVAPSLASVVLTGPNLAHEIAADLPAAAVAASADPDAAVRVQQYFSSDQFRVYTHHDVVGCELAGALKNVMALALGMADGLGLGVNAKASLLTRGLAEMSRLGVALGGEEPTFSGLAGLGDLVATCTSPHSRNRTFGERLAQGLGVAQIESGMSMVAEGVRSSAAALTLAGRVGVEMPIAEAVVAVLEGRQTPAEATLRLMRRHPRNERHGVPGTVS